MMNTLLDWVSSSLSPTCIAFALILLGCLLGKIQIKGISLGVAGVLLVSLVFGFLLSILSAAKGNEWFSSLYSQSFQASLKTFSTLGTALFVSSMGIQAGYELLSAKEKTISLFLIGLVTVFINRLLAAIILLADPRISPSLLYGIFCGAMTSTPGLAALSDNPVTDPDLAATGYGGAYLIGVIGIVLFVQILCRSQAEEAESVNEHSSTSSQPQLNGLLQVAVSILLGCCIGAVQIPIVRLSLGNSGGILLSGILTGLAVSKSKTPKRIPPEIINALRNLGLMLFFIGTGIPAGSTLPDNLTIKTIVYGCIFTVSPLLLGYGITSYMNYKKSGQRLSILCGIMTSSPAMSLLLQKKTVQANHAMYTVAYTGALIAMVLCMRTIQIPY